MADGADRFEALFEKHHKFMMSCDSDVFALEI